MDDTAGKVVLEIPDHLYDGYQVHRAVLAKGIAVLALPRQVLLAGKDEPVPAQISFTHGVPEASTLSAVTFAQDQRLRRALVERAKVAVPRGATFTWRSMARAEEWAQSIGYPVVVKDAVGENPSRAVQNVVEGEGLRKAFQYLRRRRPEDRSPGSNPHIAGYAATRLGYALDDDGNEVAPLRTRMLVEKQMPGTIVRSAVAGGRIVASIIHGKDGAEEPRRLESELSEPLQHVIRRAADAIPGLGFAMVDVVVSADPATASDAVVVEVGERPRLRSFAAVDDSLAEKIASAIVAFQAEQAGITLGEDLATISGQLVIDGLRDASADIDALIACADRIGVALERPAVDEVEGRVTASVTSAPKDMAAMVELLMAGKLIDDRAMSIEYRNGISHD